VKEKGVLYIVGLGPGDRTLMTDLALTALRQAETVIGYSGYFTWIGDLMDGKECLQLPLGAEQERADLAVRRALEGRPVCVISSGDPGVYGMASPILETLAKLDPDGQLHVVIVPGVSAVHAAAALLGAPLGHDFTVISLSDLLTSWPQIERRLRAAADADFVTALLNPRSKRRDWQFQCAQDILLTSRPAETPVGVVRNAYRPGQSVELTTLSQMSEVLVDMFTTVIVGNSCTRRLGNTLVTPRGFCNAERTGQRVDEPAERRPGAERPAAESDEILSESFRIIDGEMGAHPFSAVEWPIVRRMIHASGDLELAKAVCFHQDAVRAGLRALRHGCAIVTDVRMVAAGINKPALHALDIRLHCYIDDPGVCHKAKQTGRTRSYWAMKRAIASVNNAVYVIGNAPTALAAVCEGARQGTVRPRLVLAMPVGFVSVVESKEEALTLPVPVIAVRGRKGGSAVAAACMNALLHMALEGRKA
jgi:precorrin-3B C17-methyltransferase